MNILSPAIIIVKSKLRKKFLKIYLTQYNLVCFIHQDKQIVWNTEHIYVMHFSCTLQQEDILKHTISFSECLVDPYVTADYALKTTAPLIYYIQI
jgi:hypothetical protein